MARLVMMRCENPLTSGRLLNDIVNGHGNWTRIFRQPKFTENKILYCDADGSGGIGLYLPDHFSDGQAAFLSERVRLIGSLQAHNGNIAVLEFVALAMGLAAVSWIGKRVCLFTDNKVVEFVTRKGSSSNPVLIALAGMLWPWMVDSQLAEDEFSCVSGQIYICRTHHPDVTSTCPG